MTNRRDWCLQQLGITRWQVRNPAALRGDVFTPLADSVRLVVVAQPGVSPTDPLIADVLRALQLAAHQVLLLDASQLSTLDWQRPCNSWWLGITAPPLAGVQLISPELALLKRSAPARAELWQQIYQHEHDFFPDTV